MNYPAFEGNAQLPAGWNAAERYLGNLAVLQPAPHDAGEGALTPVTGRHQLRQPLDWALESSGPAPRLSGVPLPVTKKKKKKRERNMRDAFTLKIQLKPPAGRAWAAAAGAARLAHPLFPFLLGFINEAPLQDTGPETAIMRARRPPCLRNGLPPRAR